VVVVVLAPGLEAMDVLGDNPAAVELVVGAEAVVVVEPAPTPIPIVVPR